MLQNILGNIKVITIKKNIQKQACFKKYFEDLNFEFFIGVDMYTDFLEYKYVANFPQEVFDELDFNKAYAQTWTKGQFGCYATEKMIFRMSENSVSNLTIFLDDAVPERDWQQNLERAYLQLPPTWDALILGTRLGNEQKRYIRPFVYLKRKVQTILSGKRFPFTKRWSANLDIKKGSYSGLFGIIYSPSGIKKLINEPKRLREDMDDYLISRLSLNYLNVFITYPQVVREGNYAERSGSEMNDFN